MSTGSPAVNYSHRITNRPVVFSPPIRSSFPPLWKVVPSKRSCGSVPHQGLGSSQRPFPFARMNNGASGSQRELYTDQVDSFPPNHSLDSAITFTQADVNLVLYGRDYPLSREGYDKLPHLAELGSGHSDTISSVFRSQEVSKTPRCPAQQIPTGTGVQVKFSPGKMPAHSTHGVFSTIRLECGVRFGPYTGKKVYLSEVKSKDDNSRMWEVFINGQLSHFIDGRGACANWMTYVRCARTRQEQNLVVTQHDGQIFYEVCDVIEPSKELLVWYGTDYDLYLGIPTGLKLTNEKGDMKLMHQESRKEKSSDQGYHFGRPEDQGYQCDRCGRMFAYNYYRDKHLKYTPCVDSGNRKFPCDLCPRSFEKRDRLRIHVLHVHEKHRPHSCHVCQKTFSQSSSLNKHMRVHNGERPYKCVFCGKSFTASSILRTHIRQHSGEKPFKCKFCGKAFASHAAHDSHVRRTHAQFGRVPDVFQLNDQFPRNKGVADVIRDEEQTTRRTYQESITSPGELTRDCISPGISVDSMAKQNNRSESGQAEDDFINVDE